MQDLLKFDKDTVGYPPHLSKFRRFRYFLKSKGRGLGIADWPWGSIGPRGLTHYLVKNNEIKYIIVSFVDITKQQNALKSAYKKTYFNHLTNLPNALSFKKEN